MLLKDETQRVYETIKFWKIIPQIYRHIYTHLTKSLFNPKGHAERRNSLPFLLLFILLVRQTDSLYYSTICSEESGKKMLPQLWQRAH